MPTQKRAAGKAVRLFPVPGAYINGEPAAEREVTEDEAERLLSYFPPAYTTTPPIPDEPPVIEAEVDEPEPQE